jgi:hypothetical protein
MDDAIQEAFDKVCEDATVVTEWYVVLVEEEQYYGGPEEGGWWGSNTRPVAFKKYPSQETAEAARGAVMKLAAKLNREEIRSHGRQCLKEMDWLDRRGLDADYLPEVDGPSKYSVIVTDSVPEPSYGPTHYE